MGGHPGHCKVTDLTKDTHNTCYLNMEQSGQSGPHSPAQVTQQAVGERDDFPRTFPPTPAPLIHQPSRVYMALILKLNFICSSTGGLVFYSQEERQQQEERRHAAEADGDAKLVRVPGQTGGGGIHAEFPQAGEN